MPNYQSGNFKQKNKSFKGSAKKKFEFKDEPSGPVKQSKKIKKENFKKENGKKIKGQARKEQMKMKSHGIEKMNRKNQKKQKIFTSVVEPKTMAFEKIIKASILIR